MRRFTIPLGRVLGIRLQVDATWFLVFAVLTSTLSLNYYMQVFDSRPPVHCWAAGAATALLFFVSVVLHEFGHALVARSYHMPVRRITLMLFGGVAEVDVTVPRANTEFWIAIGGPVVNLALAGLFAFVMNLTGDPLLLMMTRYLFHANLILAAYNLIPGLPLDGGRILRALIWSASRDLHKATRISAGIGRVVALLTIGAGIWAVVAGNLAAGVWIGFTGWMLESAAASQFKARTLQDLLDGHQVAQAMCCTCTTVPPEADLSEVMERYDRAGGPHCFTVVQDGEFQGLLTLRRINTVPRAAWPKTPASQVMIATEEVRQVAPDTGLWDALAQMDRDGVNQFPVTVEHQLVGMLSRDDVVSYLQTIGQVAG